MQKCFTLLLTFIVFTNHPLTAQDRVGSWSVYSSYSTINDIASLNDKVYAGTLGGLFKASDTGVEDLFTTIDGMSRQDPSQLAVNNDSDHIIMAYSNGLLNIYDSQNDSFFTIEDIFRVTEFNSKRINDLETHQGMLYTATDFGIVVFDMTNYLVSNSVLKLGDFVRGTQINSIDINADSIYCATNLGVAAASLNDNLLDQSSWQTYDDTDGFSDRMVTDIVAFNGQVYAVSNGDLYRFSAGSWIMSNTFGNGTILDFEKSENELAIVFSDRVSVTDRSGIISQIGNPEGSNIRSFKITDQQYLLGTLSNGLFTLNKTDGSVADQILPDGPFLNFFNELNIKNSELITTTSEAFPRTGDPFVLLRSYSIFSEGVWENYNRLNTPELSQFWSAFTTTQNETDYFIGSWGEGIVKHNKESNEITLFNAANSGLTGITDDRNYIVVSGLDEDAQGNIWAVSFDSNVPLNVFDYTDEQWKHFEREPIASGDLYFDLFIDSNDQKWISIVNFDGTGKGLLVIDTNDLNDPDDDEFKKLTSGINNGNLPDEEVKAVIEDKEGEVWIGTARGIARFIFPDFIAESTNPSEYRAQWLINEDTSAASRFLLRDINVTSMAVNSANEKWIGSENQGLWLLNSEGSRILKRFTEENSPLISNSINSISIDERSGEVFISTDLGLVSYQDLPNKPVNEMKELKVYPNPFVYDRHEQIIIDGLSEETRIRVLGVDGKIVNEIEVRGGRTRWNGLDHTGRKLGSGVYVIVAVDSEGNGKGIGKVVIIN